MTNDDEVDELSLTVGRLRGRLAALDLQLFSTWKLIGSFREENFPVTPSQDRAAMLSRKQSSSALRDML